MQKVTLKVDAYIKGGHVSVESAGVGETAKRAKVQAYQKAMSALKSKLPDPTARYMVVRIERLSTVTL